MASFAAKAGFSKTHVSNVLGGKQPGTLRMLEAVLRAAKVPIEAVLQVPAEPGSDKARELEMLSAFRALTEREQRYFLHGAEVILAAKTAGRKRPQPRRKP